MTYNEMNKGLIMEYFRRYKVGTAYDVKHFIWEEPIKCHLGGSSKRHRVPSIRTLSQLLKRTGLRISHHQRMNGQNIPVYTMEGGDEGCRETSSLERTCLKRSSSTS